MRSRMAANRRRGIATSAVWKNTYRACAMTFAPILMSFSRSVVSAPCFTDRDHTSAIPPDVRRSTT